MAGKPASRALRWARSEVLDLFPWLDWSRVRSEVRLDAGLELLSKPYRREELARKLRHVLNNRRQQSLAQARQRVPRVRLRLHRVLADDVERAQARLLRQHAVLHQARVRQAVPVPEVAGGESGGADLLGVGALFHAPQFTVPA